MNSFKVNSSIEIREFGPDDSLEEARELINATMNRMERRAHYGGTAEIVKRYIYSGYGAWEGDKMVAFVGINLSDETRHAALEFGCLVEYEPVLKELVEKSEAFVRRKDGKRLMAQVILHFGQVRNPFISLFESCGFTSDEYLMTTTNMDLRNWDAPKDFDSSGIEPATKEEIDQVRQILEEDGEEYLAKMFVTQFSIHPNYKRHRPDHVFLVLRPVNVENAHKPASSHTEIVGIAYYRVHAFEKNKEDHYVSSAFGIHFRPKYKISREEKRRFLQGAYLSMKQLGVKVVVSTMNFKHFDIFAAIAAEGFEHMNTQNHSLLLSKDL